MSADTLPTAPASPWWTALQAAEYMGCGLKLVYTLCRSGKLRHAKIGGRRDIGTRAEWCDECLMAHVEPREVRR